MNGKIVKILKILEKYSIENLNFKNYFLAAGCLNQKIFNYYHNYDLDYGIEDYNIVYYDEDISYESEDKIIKDLTKRLNKFHLSIDIKNEKRVPIWYNKKYGTRRKEYLSVEDAIKRWGTIVTCIGVRFENNKFKVFASYDLNALFELIIKSLKIDFNEKEYQKSI